MHIGDYALTRVLVNYRYRSCWTRQAEQDREEDPIEIPGEPLAEAIVGPWINDLWDPIAISPEMGQLLLIYEIDPAVKNLVFTDGKVSIDGEGLLKRR